MEVLIQTTEVLRDLEMKGQKGTSLQKGSQLL